jgi:hypothetical protein
MEAVAEMYRLRATCQQQQVLVRAVAWGYIMPISAGYKTNWQQSSTCGTACCPFSGDTQCYAGAA